VLVPAIDADGNEAAGLRLPEQAVPAATTTGWSLRSAEAGGAGELCYLDGYVLPFPGTAAAREAAKDSRASLAERYGDKERYLVKVREAALALQNGGYLLAEDVDRIVRRAERLALFEDVK
jgi:Alpha/beta hydrolase domain